MSWNIFIYIAIAASVLWTAGALVSIWAGPADKVRRSVALSLFTAGSLVFLSFAIGLWISLGRAPLRTSGETRLWYSLFLSLMGLTVYGRHGYRWILPLSAVMACMFAWLNVFRPQLHDSALMPALQSVWFVPHVIVYMFAYAMMGVATLQALFLLVRRKPASEEETAVCNNIVRTGWGFLTLGIVMGALWAKAAWGDWWGWDPKETWAAVTWLAYMMYIHARPVLKGRPRLGQALLIVAFLLLQMCWWGVNYLPSAQGVSVHIY